jgi:hypothetical protein
MDGVASHMVRLRNVAEISMLRLLRLGEHLNVLHELIRHDKGGKVLRVGKDIGLINILTWLGRNKTKFESASIELDLLKVVAKYRDKAMEHVVATLETLFILDADMEELRAGVAAPNLVGSTIPVETHLDSIRVRVEKLKEGQLRARA